MTDVKAPSGTIGVRATVNLAGLRAGETAIVDPRQPHVAECLHGQFLVPLEQAQQERDADSS